MRSLTEQKTGRILLLILAVAVFLRVGVALYLGDLTPPADETAYSAQAGRTLSALGSRPARDMRGRGAGVRRRGGAREQSGKPQVKASLLTFHL